MAPDGLRCPACRHDLVVYRGIISDHWIIRIIEDDLSDYAEGHNVGIMSDCNSGLAQLPILLHAFLMSNC